jgi:hypothetical protein
MNLVILFVLICILCLISFEIYSKTPTNKSSAFMFSRAGGGKGGGKGAGKSKGGGKGGKGGGKGGKGGGKGRGPKGSPGGGGGGPPDGNEQNGGQPGGRGGSGGSGPEGGGIPVTSIDQLDAIFKAIGFKFNSQNVQPPQPGSNNDKLDDMLKKMMNS